MRKRATIAPITIPPIWPPLRPLDVELCGEVEDEDEDEDEVEVNVPVEF